MAPSGQELCACGSGLRTVRCCALDVLTQADPVHYVLLATQVDAVAAAQADGRLRDATRLLLKLLDLVPLLPGALLRLAEIRLAEGQKNTAAILFARLLETGTETPELLLSYARILESQGKYTEAVEIARRGLLAQPNEVAFHQILGVSFTESGRLQAGEYHYRRALNELPPGPARLQVKNNLCWNFRQQGRLEEAATLYSELFAEGGVSQRGLVGFAQVEAGLGRLDATMALLTQALEQSPRDRLSAWLWAAFKLQQGSPEGALERIAASEAMLAPERLVVSEYTVRGRALERLGRFDEAWAAYHAGRERQRGHVQKTYDPEPSMARLAAIKKTFKADWYNALPWPTTTPAKPQPVFLLATPRSGSALLEHLLGQSSQISPANQSGIMPELATLLPALVRAAGGPDMPFPEALTTTICADSADIPADLAQRYLRHFSNIGVADAQTRFITDRHADLPWLLGLVNMLFPQAPIIHLLRHPLDVVLSGYTQDRMFEGDAGLTLDSLAAFYDMQMQAISHCRGQLTMRYLPVRYEDLVTNPAQTLGRIHKFIGLKKADPKALITAPPRAVPRVPAYRMQLGPLNDRGLYRHRRFNPEIFASCLPRLAPWIERLGYGATQKSDDRA